MNSETVKAFIKKGMESPHPDVPPVPKGLSHDDQGQWQWLTWCWALDMLESCMGEMRMAAMNGDVEKMMVVYRAFIPIEDAMKEVLTYPLVHEVMMNSVTNGGSSESVMGRYDRLAEEWVAGELLPIMREQGWDDYWLQVKWGDEREES